MDVYTELSKVTKAIFLRVTCKYLLCKWLFLTAYTLACGRKSFFKFELFKTWHSQEMLISSFTNTHCSRSTWLPSFWETFWHFAVFFKKCTNLVFCLHTPSPLKQVLVSSHFTSLANRGNLKKKNFCKQSAHSFQKAVIYNFWEIYPDKSKKGPFLNEVKDIGLM